MELPSVAPAPVVRDHAAVFRDLCDNPCQCRHCQHDLSGRIVLPNKRLAHIARGSLDRTDTTNRARVLSEAPWREAAVKRRRIRCRLQQTTAQRPRRRASRVVMDDTRCEPVGRLFDDVDRHSNPSDGTDPVAQNPVTSVDVSGPVRFPGGRRRSRRYAALPPWEATVAKPVPARPIPTATQARKRRHTAVDPVWRQDPACRARHAPFRTTLRRAVALVAEAIRGQGPCGVVVCDAWYVAADWIQVLARRRQDWIRRLQQNRGLDTASVHLRDAKGWPLKRPGPHRAGAALVPLIPANASRPINVSAYTSWCLTLGGRLPGRGQVRIVGSCAHEPRTGRDVVVVTKRVDWRAATSVSMSVQRWPTATRDQTATGRWGSMRSACGVPKPLGNIGVGASWPMRGCT